MTRFITVAMMAIACAPTKDQLIQASAIIDDALMAIRDISPSYYDLVITKLQSVFQQKSTVK